MSRAWSWRHTVIKSKLKPTTRHILLTLSCFMDDTGGSCYPTIEQLSEASGLSGRAVITHLSLAEEAGFLQKSKHGFAGQKWANNQYQATWPEGEKGSEPPSPPSKKVVNLTTEGSEPPSRKVVNDVHTTSPITNPKPFQGAGACERGEGAHTPAHPSGKTEAERKRLVQQLLKGTVFTKGDLVNDE